jgi:hypothetical protein
MAESHGNPEAYNIDPDGTVDRGLMEINSVHSNLVNGNVLSLYNPQVNIEIAYEIYLTSGWRAWSSYDTGQYLRFL